MNAAQRARLDAILDAGLAHAPEAERAWLAGQREADAAFDAEVAELLALEERVLAWGAHTAERGAASSALDGALAAIFDGIDTGLYDDDLRLDDASALADELALADGDAGVVAIGAAAALRSGEQVRAPRPVAPVAEAPPAQAAASAVRVASSSGPGGVVRLLRDNRLAQVLAAAAAVLVVVSAGFSAVRVASPAQDESAIAASAPMAAAPAPVVTPVPTAAPAAVAFEAPAEAEPEAPPEAPTLEATAELAGELLDAVPAPAAPVAQPSADRATGGVPASPEGRGSSYGGEADVSDTEQATSSGAARTHAATSTASARPANMSASPQGSGGYADDFFAASPDSPRREVVAETASVGASTSRSATAHSTQAPTPAPAPPAARYRTWTALRPVLTACLGPGRDATVEIARTTGRVRVLSAPSASASERRCLESAAGESAISPAPTVTRQLRVSRAAAAVSDTSTQ